MSFFPSQGPLFLVNGPPVGAEVPTGNAGLQAPTSIAPSPLNPLRRFLLRSACQKECNNAKRLFNSSILPCRLAPNPRQGSAHKLGVYNVSEWPLRLLPRPLNSPPSGRKRRKKCDEVKPRCKGCSRNGLQCTWPTVVDLVADRRRAPWSWKSQRSLPGGFSDLSLQPADHVTLFSHFANSIMPRIVRQDCRPEYSNQEYMLRLAHVSPPLMAVIIAIAAFDMKTRHYERLAMESYRLSLHNLRVRIGRAPNAGNDDALLATTIFLCVFEVS